MKIQFYKPLVTFLLFISSFGVANAFTISVDTDPGTTGIQSSLEATMGTPFTVNIVASGNTTAISGGFFDVSWDSSVLQFDPTTSGTIGFGPNYDSAAILSPFDPTNSDEGSLSSGTMQHVNPFSFTAITLSSFDVYQMTFTPIATTSSGSSLSVLPDSDNGGSVWVCDAFTDPTNCTGAGGTLPVTFDTAATISVVSAVPVPPAFLLFGTGLLGLVAVGRRNRAA